MKQLLFVKNIINRNQHSNGNYFTPEALSTTTNDEATKKQDLHESDPGEEQSNLRYQGMNMDVD